jgi:hypothetical protein
MQQIRQEVQRAAIDKIRSTAKGNWRSLLLLLVVVAISGFVYKQWKNKTFSFVRLFGKASGVDGRSMSTSVSLSDAAGGMSEFTTGSTREALARLAEEVSLGSPLCPERFDFRGYYVGKFVSCYDGDTCDVVVMVPQGATQGAATAPMPMRGYKLVRFRARTIGYNAPEIRLAPDAPNRDATKKLAVESREMLWQKTTGLSGTDQTYHTRLVLLKCQGFDKYGRLLVEAFNMKSLESGQIEVDDRESVNKSMLRWLGPEYEMDDKGSMVHK